MPFQIQNKTKWREQQVPTILAEQSAGKTVRRLCPCETNGYANVTRRVKRRAGKSQRAPRWRTGQARTPSESSADCNQNTVRERDSLVGVVVRRRCRWRRRRRYTPPLLPNAKKCRRTPNRYTGSAVIVVAEHRCQHNRQGTRWRGEVRVPQQRWRTTAAAWTDSLNFPPRPRRRELAADDEEGQEGCITHRRRRLLRGCYPPCAPHADAPYRLLFGNIRIPRKRFLRLSVDKSFVAALRRFGRCGGF